VNAIQNLDNRYPLGSPACGLCLSGISSVILLASDSQFGVAIEILAAAGALLNGVLLISRLNTKYN